MIQSSHKYYQLQNECNQMHVAPNNQVSGRWDTKHHARVRNIFPDHHDPSDNISVQISTYEYLKILHYLCFRGWGIHFWYSYWATMFRWPRKCTHKIVGTQGSGSLNRQNWTLAGWPLNNVAVFVSASMFTVDTLYLALCSQLPDSTQHRLCSWHIYIYLFSRYQLTIFRIC